MFTLDDLLQDPLYNLPKLLIVRYSGLISAVVLLLDYASTLENEVKFIWPSRWNVVKLIFLVNRYSPFVDVIINICLMMVPMPAESCPPLFEAMVGTYAIGCLASELILMARTLALYDFSNMVLCIMVVLGLGILVPSVAISTPFLHTLAYPSDAVIRVIGCVPGAEDRPLWPFYLSVLISETVVVILTMYKMWEGSDTRHHRSVLVRRTYRDGSLYYFVILAFSVANLCLMLTAPKAASPLRVVHSTLCTRVLLNLRAVAAKLSDLSLQDFQQSRLEFELSADTRNNMSLFDIELDTLEDDYRYR
ncbi:hypothetical protein C2E23DRAFT_883039 [Lenzites betulinus]|nr:hypothetical protein C2E23DRAFT_883039 [Lenzites betulinus]